MNSSGSANALRKRSAAVRRRKAPARSGGSPFSGRNRAQTARANRACVIFSQAKSRVSPTAQPKAEMAGVAAARHVRPEEQQAEHEGERPDDAPDQRVRRQRAEQMKRLFEQLGRADFPIISVVTRGHEG